MGKASLTRVMEMSSERGRFCLSPLEAPVSLFAGSELSSAPAQPNLSWWFVASVNQRSSEVSCGAQDKAQDLRLWLHGANIAPEVLSVMGVYFMICLHRGRPD